MSLLLGGLIGKGKLNAPTSTDTACATETLNSVKSAKSKFIHGPKLRGY